MANRNNARRHLKRTQLSGGWSKSNKYNSASPGLYLERFFGNAATLHVDAEPDDDDEDEYQGLTKQDDNNNDKSHRDSASLPVDGADSEALEEDAAALTQANVMPTVYPNGTVVKKVTAYDYSKFETYSIKPSPILKYCSPYCDDVLCLRFDSTYQVPSALTSRGLQMTEKEFRQILKSLSEAANVTFFQKAVDCSLPCFYLTGILIASFISFCFWFLIVGGLLHYQTGENSIAAPTFWSFMLLVIFVPGTAALIMLAVLIHLANYKYLKYRLKVEEYNKKFRDTNLVLHVIKGFWGCSGKLKLYFIYFNFTRCQQTLYDFVHDKTRLSLKRYGGENSLLFGNRPTLKLDKIMKRVNTLTKKFELDYFEALTKETLPQTSVRLHRNKGMCFCQYIRHQDKLFHQTAAKKTKSQLKTAQDKSPDYVRRWYESDTMTSQEICHKSGVIYSCNTSIDIERVAVV